MADKAIMFEWEDRYAIDVPAIDAQHKKMFAIATELHAALVAGRARALCERILYRLVKYTLVHFQYEEHVMRTAGFPGSDAHKKLHDDFIAQVDGFVRDYKEGRRVISLQLLHAVSEWLVDHIAGADREFASCVKSSLAA
jgi:hemerythrin